MDELISRAAAIACLGNSPNEICMPWSEVERMLRGLPAVDAAPVIRCKDCKHWGVVDGCNWMTCMKGILTGWGNKGYGFCSYGERKSNIEGN